MASPLRFPRIPTLKSVADFRAHLTALGVSIPCDDAILTAEQSPLARPVGHLTVNGRIIGNRWAIHPMEGWDGHPDGTPSDAVRRRWRRFGISGAKLIFGGEAMAVRPDGRANPSQLVIIPAHARALRALRDELVRAHEERFGAESAADLVIGFQLTHSGRFCKPNDKGRFEPRVAQRHPLLDER